MPPMLACIGLHWLSAQPLSLPAAPAHAHAATNNNARTSFVSGDERLCWQQTVDRTAHIAYHTVKTGSALLCLCSVLQQKLQSSN
jgi:hypothetical protein